MPSAMTEALLKELEKGNWNVKPGKLRQGSVTAFPPEGLTEEQLEAWWDKLYENHEKDMAEWRKNNGQR